MLVSRSEKRTLTRKDQLEQPRVKTIFSAEHMDSFFAKCQAHSDFFSASTMEAHANRDRAISKKKKRAKNSKGFIEKAVLDEREATDRSGFENCSQLAARVLLALPDLLAVVHGVALGGLVDALTPVSRAPRALVTARHRRRLRLVGAVAVLVTVILSLAFLRRIRTAAPVRRAPRTLVATNHVLGARLPYLPRPKRQKQQETRSK